MRDFVASEMDVGGLKEARAEEVAKSMVLFVEGEDGG